LCDGCGQLWVYPDTGSPEIVVEAATDPEAVAAMWEEAERAEDAWRSFHERMYGAR
jgi:hypothetical protein